MEDWGQWMGAWKAAAGQVDQEQERIDRQKAAFGAETLSRIKDINVLIVGCRGVGVETAKNLILSNIGGVVIYDPTPASIRDMGANFYINESHVQQGVPRATACLSQLRELNPYCKVDVCESASLRDVLVTADVLHTGKPFTAVVLTQLLPKTQLFELNEIARRNNIAFLLAINTGVTASLFSDFGTEHEITDATGEPLTTLAVANIEVLRKPAILKVSGVNDGEDVVIVTVAQPDHKLDEGDTVVLDDMRGDLSVFNTASFQVKHVSFVSPRDAKLDITSTEYLEVLKLPTTEVLGNFEHQYEYYSHACGDAKLPVRQINIRNRLAIVLPNDVSPEPFRTYESGGLLNQKKPPIHIQHKSLESSLLTTINPCMLNKELMASGLGIDIHICYATVLAFEEAKGRYPRLLNEEDAAEFVSIAKTIAQERSTSDAEEVCKVQKFEWGFPSGEVRDLDEKRVSRFSRYFDAELTGFCAYLGGAIAQEVLKKTGKFTPIDGWIHHEDQWLVCDECPTNQGPLFGTRYDYQIAVLGKDFHAQLSNQRVFLVGSGALGCEYLKGMALMGVGSGKSGRVLVTDMDTIETSNLSRQFLYRQSDVGQPKSVTGARVVKGWNPSMNIEGIVKKVGDDTEDIFDDGFWEGLDLVWNALDNVHARKYTDKKCLWHSKPLLESGTLGTKCNSDVILPFRTKSYNDGKENDANETQIAMCTLRSFPFLPLHCIEFAKVSSFGEVFEFGPQQYEDFRKSPSEFFERLEAMGEGEQFSSLSLVKMLIQAQQGGEVTFAKCVQLAFDQMITNYRNKILALVDACDKLEASSGKPFWTGTKRKPRALDFNVPEPSHMEYLFAASNMFAFVFNVPFVRDRSEFTALVHAMHLTQPEFVATGELDTPLEEGAEEGNENSGSKAEAVSALREELMQLDVSSLIPARAHDFEKDDDSNYHIDFLTIATNLRSWNYNIKESERHFVKVTSGRIIPALATTTAMICGLVDIEFCKLVLKLQTGGTVSFLNSNINLATGTEAFNAFTPEDATLIPTELVSVPHFTTWDKIEIQGELSVSALVERLEGMYGLKVVSLYRAGYENVPMFTAEDKKKLEWHISITDGVVECSEGLFSSQWGSTLNMAVKMLQRLPPTSGQRRVFETQVQSVKTSLEATQRTFHEKFHGGVSEVYRAAYRTSTKEDELEYFDAVFEKRNYLILQGQYQNMEGADAMLPNIKYVFRA